LEALTIDIIKKLRFGLTVKREYSLILDLYQLSFHNENNVGFQIMFISADQIEAVMLNKTLTLISEIYRSGQLTVF
jgi:hypothetical protein